MRLSAEHDAVGLLAPMRAQRLAPAPPDGGGGAGLALNQQTVGWTEPGSDAQGAAESGPVSEPPVQRLGRFMEKVGVFVSSSPRADASAAPQPVAVGHTRRIALAGEPVRQRVHEEHLFGLLLQGQGTYQLGPDLLPLGEPIAWFQPAGESERIQMHGSIDGWWIGFYWPGLRVKARGEQVTIRVNNLTHSSPRWKRLNPAVIPQMVEVFQSLLASAGAMDLTRQLRTRGLLQQLLGLFFEQPVEVAARTNHWALEKFKYLLESRACENVSIEDLAAEVQMSADHLRTLFHQRFGRSPLEFRIALRLAMAKELLCSSNLYIKEVAHRVGYPDPLYFSRAFKTHFGVSPREVIRRSRQTIEAPE